MARSHFRFVVRDAYGYAIQNAKVNVYLPDTTTVFAGTAYDASSGGSTVTNPFTTNAQGEIEAWFDTAQSVDVQVDDNTDAAYRAVEGAATPLSFTTFTEEAEIHVNPSDVQIDTAVVTHGAADHTNIQRSFFLPVLDVVNDGGTIATRGTAPEALRVLTLADAAVTGMSWAFAIPDDWDSGDLSVAIYHAGQTTTTGTIRWQMKALSIPEGDSIVGTSATSTFTGASVTTADLLVIEDSTTILTTPVAAGELYRLNVRRLGTDGADTYAASTSLIGVLVSYTANQ